MVIHELHDAEITLIKIVKPRSVKIGLLAEGEKEITVNLNNVILFKCNDLCFQNVIFEIGYRNITACNDSMDLISNVFQNYNKNALFETMNSSGDGLIYLWIQSSVGADIHCVCSSVDIA